MTCPPGRPRDAYLIAGGGISGQNRTGHQDLSSQSSMEWFPHSCRSDSHGWSSGGWWQRKITQETQDRWGYTVIQVGIHCYTSGDTLLYKWGYIAIQVGIHCYTSGDTLLYKWGYTAIQVEIHCYTSGDTLLYKWGYTAIQVGINSYTSGNTELYKWGSIAKQVGMEV